jgi:hypothetical protein
MNPIFKFLGVGTAGFLAGLSSDKRIFPSFVYKDDVRYTEDPVIRFFFREVANPLFKLIKSMRFNEAGDELEYRFVAGVEEFIEHVKLGKIEADRPVDINFIREKIMESLVPISNSIAGAIGAKWDNIVSDKAIFDEAQKLMNRYIKVIDKMGKSIKMPDLLAKHVNSDTNGQLIYHLAKTDYDQSMHLDEQILIKCISKAAHKSLINEFKLSNVKSCSLILENDELQLLVDVDVGDEDEENDVEEQTTTANIAGYSLPLGMSNKKNPDGSMEKTIKRKGYKFLRTGSKLTDTT